MESTQYLARSGMVLETVNNTRKNRMHGAIKRNDLAAVVTYIETESFPVNEEISVAGYHWTSLHYAAHFGTADILAYLIEKLYNDFDNIRRNVNVQTREGWTPLMIGSIYGQIECVRILVRSGAADLEMKDIKGKTARDLALLYKKTEVHEFLVQTERGLSGEGGFASSYATGSRNENSSSGATSSSGSSGSKAAASGSGSHLKPEKSMARTVTNIGKLSEDSKALDNESLDESRELLTKGHRLPCLLCLDNKGLLQYLVCCGHPIHPLCWPMNMRNICPSCRHTGYIQLSSEVLYPERALTMNEEDTLQSSIIRSVLARISIRLTLIASSGKNESNPGQKCGAPLKEATE